MFPSFMLPDPMPCPILISPPIRRFPCVGRSDERQEESQLGTSCILAKIEARYT